ncbi:hypothetical protein [Sphingopyxis sp. KK2]|uniref:hypothetical protein n=1 Tax=Sphingopyxis sp. KK2 TaxID=1855727 RepID=UPI001181970A|nr:hypothetical protein [Sphingopyxis sp. KK2]
MKSMLSILGTAALATLATPALAQSAQTQSVDIIGTAEAFCTLPTTWQYASSTTGVSSSQFQGNTWTIPSALIANSSGMAIASNAEVAIRVRGQGACNTTHNITLQSTNGGLAHLASASNPPAGFARNRRMEYQANWRDTNWGIFGWVPTAAGSSNSYNHGSTQAPGLRDFDVRMEVFRDATAAPMLAGAYSDNLVITITVP